MAGFAAALVLGIFTWFNQRPPAAGSPEREAPETLAEQPPDPNTDDGSEPISKTKSEIPPATPKPETEAPGSLEETRRRMQELAEDNHAEAHLWLAKDLLQRGNPDATPPIPEEGEAGAEARRPLSQKDLGTIQRHLTSAIRIRPDLTEAIALQAGIYSTMGTPEKAIDLLDSAVGKNPQLLLHLATLYRKSGQEDLARRKAIDASQVFSESAKSNQADGVDSRIQWVKAEFFLDNHDEALRILAAGKMLKEDPRYDAWIATVNYSLARRALSGTPPQISTALNALEAGLQEAPADLRLLNELSKLSIHPDAHDRVRQILEALIASNRGSATAFLALGSQASGDGDLARAIPLIEKALELDPSIPAAKNNLAVCLIQLDPPQLERSLGLVESAIRDSTPSGTPPNPAFLETRGRIFIKLSRWTDAIADLERCLNAMPEVVRKEVHGMLALAYRNLGNESLAAEHARLAAK